MPRAPAGGYHEPFIHSPPIGAEWPWPAGFEAPILSIEDRLKPVIAALLEGKEVQYLYGYKHPSGSTWVTIPQKGLDGIRNVIDNCFKQWRVKVEPQTLWLPVYQMACTREQPGKIASIGGSLTYKEALRQHLEQFENCIGAYEVQIEDDTPVNTECRFHSREMLLR